jgi:hypothetical protein
MKTLYSGYYTSGTPYKYVIEKYLKPSLEKFNLDYYIEEVPNQGNWYKNSAYKAKFIVDVMNKFSNYNNYILLDADARIEKYPKLFDKIPEEYDIALHYLSWEKIYGYKGNPMKELLTGTMLLRDKPRIRELCKEWYNKAYKSNSWEQKILSNIINGYNLNIYFLPYEYIGIATTPRGKPHIECDPVISHHQVSRTMKLKRSFR